MTMIILYQNNYCNITKYLGISVIRKSNEISFFLFLSLTHAKSPAQGLPEVKMKVQFLTLVMVQEVYSLILCTVAPGRFVILFTYVFSTIN